MEAKRRQVRGDDNKRLIDTMAISLLVLGINNIN